jgi:hypothetical protein
MEGSPLIGYLPNAEVLCAPAPYNSNEKIPLLGQLEGRRAAVSGFIAENNYAWSLLEDDDLTEETEDARLWQLYGFYEGFEQLFVENKKAENLEVSLLLDDKIFIVPTIPAGGVWSVCVPKGSDVEIVTTDNYYCSISPNGDTFAWNDGAGEFYVSANANVAWYAISTET